MPVAYLHGVASFQPETLIMHSSHFSVVGGVKEERCREVYENTEVIWLVTFVVPYPRVMLKFKGVTLILRGQCEKHRASSSNRKLGCMNRILHRIPELAPYVCLPPLPPCTARNTVTKACLSSS